MELSQASQQWATRPADERFLSLLEMQSHFEAMRAQSREVVCSSRRIQAVPMPDNKGLMIHGPNGTGYAPTNWAFGQLAQLSESPAGYLRTLPSPIAADCINFGLQFKRDIEDVGVLLYKNGNAVMRAATGPNYGRIWNADILNGLVDRFGDGVSGDFRVPGIFGKALTDVTKQNTTLYAGDRDMFVFLADEEHRVEVPNRRDGQSGQMARGFFIWNSEVGSATFGISTFLFDYVCSNRIVWGASDVATVKVRHTAGAPDKYIQELAPALTAYAKSSTSNITRAISDARHKRLDDVDAFLANRFSRKLSESIKAAHEIDEGRPIETLWDVVTGVTAHARDIEHQNARVELERKAGDILNLA